ncbi:hypothetical protein K8B83_12080 [Shewanella inventionis]|uniref:Uncharacterized protein n=1 Tax=Shewanella inventionis TaxID=1738770 RepID=A0ABQ1J983_9GAMM|nr:hypothetical protein [Shewanella inventionis]MCL1157787.1 hypothetical protein [Shewanella inventionis]UAL41646.1 hypothetical protein K8B83_12080 [Shewanella inventionis]GGB63172.1 hypothetical protein GCM10011607_24890 [Shewanella inventionis]
MKPVPEALLKKHANLVQTEGVTVISHTQREIGDWVLQTLMIENCDVPFKYKRPKRFKSLQGQKVNLIYYPSKEVIAGFEIEIMQVVRVRRY